MLKYAQVLNQDTKECSIGLGSNAEFYKSIGMILQDVEQGYDGSWYLAGYAPHKSLDELKKEKLEEVKTEVDKANKYLNKELYFTSSLGFKCNGDRRSKDNIQDLLTFFDMQAPTGTVAFRDYENKMHELNKEQLNTLNAEASANLQAILMSKWECEEQIKQAQSIDELDAINYVMRCTNFNL